MKPQVTLEQWQALLAVVDAGGYAQAAEQLKKSQSAVSYAIQKIETALSVRIFELSGRKAVLTGAGQALYRRAQTLVEEAALTEQLAAQYAQGWEADVKVAVDTIVPDELILHCLAQFAAEAPQIRVELRETVLSGTEEAIRSKAVDLAIGSLVPVGYLGTPLMRTRFVAVAHPNHPLHQLGRPLTQRDLRKHRQLVVRDSGSRNINAGWLGADQRWTLSHLHTSIHAACLGLGYAWYPEPKIRQQLEQGRLKQLPLEEGWERFVQLNLTYSHGEFAGPAARRLGELFLAHAKAEYPECQ